jgi:ligand-binding sensor protein
MNLTDILPLKYWVEFEKEINKSFGLNASVFDKDGIKITDYMKWVNSLCPVVKANKQGQSYICAVAHQYIAGEAAKSGDAVVGECDAGLVKIAVPIFVDGEFLGVAGGCGKIVNGNEVDSFLVNKLMGIDQERIKKLSEDITAMTAEDPEKIVVFIEQRLDEMLREFDKLPKRDMTETASVFHLSGAK